LYVLYVFLWRYSRKWPIICPLGISESVRWASEFVRWAIILSVGLLLCSFFLPRIWEKSSSFFTASQLIITYSIKHRYRVRYDPSNIGNNTVLRELMFKMTINTPGGKSGTGKCVIKKRNLWWQPNFSCVLFPFKRSG